MRLDPKGRSVNLKRSTAKLDRLLGIISIARMMGLVLSVASWSTQASGTLRIRNCTNYEWIVRGTARHVSRKSRK